MYQTGRQIDRDKEICTGFLGMQIYPSVIEAQTLKRPTLAISCVLLEKQTRSNLPLA